MFNLIGRLWVVLSFGMLSPATHAALINWTFEATISATQAAFDPLNIDGETLNISMLFDDTNIWKSNGYAWVVPSLGATAQITGGHTVEVTGTQPNAALSYTPLTVGFIAASDSTNFIGLLIDGMFAQLLDFRGASTVRPFPGDNLQFSHLPSYDWRVGSGMDYPITPPGQPFVQDYLFTNVKLGGGANVVPSPATLTLLLIGMAGLFAVNRLPKVSVYLRTF